MTNDGVEKQAHLNNSAEMAGSSPAMTVGGGHMTNYGGEAGASQQ
jgi:hypothetical protein